MSRSSGLAESHSDQYQVNMPKFIVFGVLATGLMIGCTGERPDQPEGSVEDERGIEIPSPDPDSPDVAGLTCEGLEEKLLLAHASRAELAGTFGTPDSVNSTTEPNRHVPGATDSLFVVHYPGLVAHFRKPSEGDDLVSFVEVEDNRYLQYPSIGVGATEERVVSVLGEPGTHEPGRLVYECAGVGPEQPVTFRLSDGVVERIEIAYYVD